MRTLFVPAIIVVLGVVAALPFRHSTTVSSEDSTESTNNSAGSVAENSLPPTFPSTVAPLQLDAFASSETANRLLTQLHPLIADKPESTVPKLETLPKSYDDIAVPLADRDTAKNLLKSSSRLAETSLSGNNWTFDRFGIPRPAGEIRGDSPSQNEWFASSATSVERTPAGADLASADASHWSSARPIVERAPAELVLASEVKPEQSQQYQQLAEQSGKQIHQQTPVEDPASVSVGGAKVYGAKVYQAVKDTRVKLRHQSAEGTTSQQTGKLQTGNPPQTGSAPQKAAAQQTVSEPTERKRFWIHEPARKSG